MEGHLKGSYKGPWKLDVWSSIKVIRELSLEKLSVTVLYIGYHIQNVVVHLVCDILKAWI